MDNDSIAQMDDPTSLLIPKEYEFETMGEQELQAQKQKRRENRLRELQTFAKQFESDLQFVDESIFEETHK